jgi:hypothetical protein
VIARRADPPKLAADHAGKTLGCRPDAGEDYGEGDGFEQEGETSFAFGAAGLVAEGFVGVDLKYIRVKRHSPLSKYDPLSSSNAARNRSRPWAGREWRAGQLFIRTHYVLP